MGEKNIDENLVSENKENHYDNLPEGEIIDDWLDLLDNKAILKKTISLEKDHKSRINRGNCVKINLETRNYETQDLIESETFKNLEVIVGDYDIIHGVNLVLPMMCLNEVSRVLIDPRFAYGLKGKDPDVPPNCRLDCRIEILELDENYLQTKSIDEQMELINKKKNKGNFWFSREDYTTAINCYKICLEICENVESLLSETNDNNLKYESLFHLKSNIYNNLSLCQFKSGSINQALQSVDEVLKIFPENVKALYRKSLLLEEKGDLKESINLLKKALELDEKNILLINKLNSLKKKLTLHLDNEKQMYKKMFNIQNMKETKLNDISSKLNENLNDNLFKENGYLNEDKYEKNENLQEISYEKYKKIHLKNSLRKNSKYFFIFSVFILLITIFLKLYLI